jgi:hypothetical protein
MPGVAKRPGRCASPDFGGKWGNHHVIAKPGDHRRDADHRRAKSGWLTSKFKTMLLWCPGCLYDRQVRNLLLTSTRPCTQPPEQALHSSGDPPIGKDHQPLGQPASWPAENIS